MSNIMVEELKQTPMAQQRIELVERKGTGHHDSICDAIMERVSLALCREYLCMFGRILHYNVDKGLLVAGRTQPRLGGGTVLEPMRLVFGDRATAENRGKRIDVGALAATAKDWLRQHLRYVEPERHIVFQNELKQSSPSLLVFLNRKWLAQTTTGVLLARLICLARFS